MKQRNFAAMILFCITLLTPLQCDQTEPTNISRADEYVGRGELLMDQGKFAEAVTMLTLAIEEDPSLSIAYFNRGKALFSKAEYILAVDDFTAAITLKPDYTDAYYYRAWASIANGAVDRAIYDFDMVIQRDASFPVAYYGRQWCYAEKAQWSKSSQLLMYQKFESDAGLAAAYTGRSW
ncbi:MAG TPA: tetratricopeptide repeat protein, partial [Dehalococcoidia bacterium]|nr:tetratricopeptide repeat protein [Dehalococcoidia bacterium]